MTVTPESLSQLQGIKLQSPLAILGAFLFIIRDRFKPESGLSWTWVDDAATTDILIETQYNPNTETRDVRPAIYVDRDQTAYDKASIGHLDQSQPGLINKSITHHISMGHTDLIIDVVSPSRGESMVLADIVQQFIESSRYVLMASFGFRDMSPVVMGRTQPFVKQDDLHQTTLTLRVDYETQWAVAPIAPMLSAIRVLTEAGGTVGPNRVLANFYLKATK